MIDNDKITVTIKIIYGMEHVYPVTHKTALQTLMGNKTLTVAKIRALAEMGFTFECINPPMSMDLANALGCLSGRGIN